MTTTVAYQLPHVLTVNLLVPAEPVSDALGFTNPRELLRHITKPDRVVLPAAPYGKAGQMAYLTSDGFRRALRIPIKRYGEERRRIEQFRLWVDECFMPELGLECIDSIQGGRR